MRARLFLLVSLGLNLVLAGGWYFAVRQPAVKRPPVIRRPVTLTNIVRPIRTNLIISPQVLSWDLVESSDYLTYIANLRAIGCPPQTIRDIIVADVNQLFARRRAREFTSPAMQWWRSDPDMDALQANADKAQQLELERRQLLSQLLGPDWDSGETAVAVFSSSTLLDGPVLADLSPEAKTAVRDLEARSLKRESAYREAQAQAGKPLDPAELARLRQVTREELAKVLSPAEMEEYLLRYSRNAAQLREALRGLEASPEEFRRLFRATDALELQLELLTGATDPASVRRREQLEAQRELALKEALKPERYQFMKLSQDPVFQQARDTAEQVGASAETVLPMYEINQTVEQERQRILEDPSLSPEEQSQQLAFVYQQQLDSLRKVLGPEAFRKYQATSTR